MAIYRLSSKSISRGNGQSAIASACYRSSDKLKDEQLNKTFDYSRKQSVYHAEIILPDNANPEFIDRGTLWNAVEKAEKRKNSELAKEYQLALPAEINNSEKIALAKQFAQDQFVARGLAVDIAYHDFDSDNPHCHIMTTTRSFDKTGTLGNKERFFRARHYLVDLRKDWEIHLNEKLAEKNAELVSCESYENRGIDLDAINTRQQGEEGKQDIAEQRYRRSLHIAQNPGVIADVLTDKSATFTEHQLKKFLDKNTMPEHRQQAIEGLAENDNLVVIDADKGIYSSANYLLSEQKLAENVDQLNQQCYTSKHIDINTITDTAQRYTLNEKQQEALLYATSADSQIKNIEGYAGTGKSHAINAIRDVYEQSGYHCHGVALSGIVADNMAKDSGINDSRTIASFLYQYDAGKINLDKKSVLVMDEASLVGTRDYERLTGIVADAGAKMICVGDDNQLQAIQAGGANRLVKEASSFVTLDDVRRQKDSQDKQASYHLSTGEQRLALEHYKAKGAIKMHQHKADMMQQIHQSYQKSHQEGKTNIIMAHRKDTVNAINQKIHDERKQNGELGASHQINGKEYSINDRFIFLQNGRQLGVRNGTTGTIERINRHGEMQIKSDDGKHINFNVKDYQKFDHAYAVTIHKAQGVTVDHAQVYFDRQANSNLCLVGCTRHKEKLEIHAMQYDKNKRSNGIKDFNDLVNVAERKQSKQLVQDYDHALTRHVNKTKDVKNAYQEYIKGIAKDLVKDNGLNKANEMIKQRQQQIKKQRTQQKPMGDGGMEMGL